MHCSRPITCNDEVVSMRDKGGENAIVTGWTRSVVSYSSEFLPYCAKAEALSSALDKKAIPQAPFTDMTLTPLDRWMMLAILTAVAELVFGPQMLPARPIESVPPETPRSLAMVPGAMPATIWCEGQSP